MSSSSGPGDARVPEGHDIAGPLDSDQIEATDDRGRRWHHSRPQPRRRTDLMGFNSTWWMVLAWVLVIALAFFPYPWWW